MAKMAVFQDDPKKVSFLSKMILGLKILSSLFDLFFRVFGAFLSVFAIGKGAPYPPKIALFKVPKITPSF